jgi:H+/Cl- antiporter ClcA
MGFHLYRRRNLTQHFRWLALSAGSGVLVGGLVSGFLLLLQLATGMRTRDPHWIFALPFFGLLSGWIFQYFGKEANRGTSLILDEIHDPQRKLPSRMIPFVIGGSFLSHLGGASVGREGAAVQIGASLCDQLARWLKVEGEERKILLVCGAGAGFAAGVGAPLAGVLFGMEVIQIGRMRWFAWLESLLACFLAVAVTHLLRLPHLELPRVEIGFAQPSLLGCSLGFGIACGLLARVFVFCVHHVEHFLARAFSQNYWRPFVAGLVLVPVFFFWKGSSGLQGLGLEEIQAAFARPAAWWQIVGKLALAALSVGAGFKGGEFIPIVFLGTTLGSMLAGLLGLPLTLFSALGFVATFAGAANTPLACVALAIELFGGKIALYALLACFFSYYASGHAGIYKAQRLAHGKAEHWRALWKLLGELPERFRS